MKKEINVFDYAGEVMKAVKEGVLITTKTEDKVNSITVYKRESFYKATT